MVIDDKASENNKIEGVGVLVSASGSTGRLSDMGKYKITGNSGEIEAKIGNKAKGMGYNSGEMIMYTIAIKPKKR